MRIKNNCAASITVVAIAVCALLGNGSSACWLARASVPSMCITLHTPLKTVKLFSVYGSYDSHTISSRMEIHLNVRFGDCLPESKQRRTTHTRADLFFEAYLGVDCRCRRRRRSLAKFVLNGFRFYFFVRRSAI